MLSSLPTRLIPSLLSFANYVADLDVDYVIFMARKAVRLHDLLIAAGCKRPKAVVVADHILDQDLSALHNKRVALIDDTLILGTTLRAAEAKLRTAGVASVQKVVFAIDAENWSEEITPVDRHFVKLTTGDMLVFCASEVEALALVGIPYLTDFPVSKLVRLSRNQLSALYNQPTWDSFALSSQRQEAVEVYYHTHLPGSDVTARLAVLVGGLSKLVDITKVRTFTFSTRDHRLCRLVPIVTLFPMSEARIDQALTALLSQVPAFTPENRERLSGYLATAKAKLRFIQYFLSVVLGEIFAAGLAETAGLREQTSFDLDEGARLFGPWLRQELAAVHDCAAQLARGMTLPLAFPEIDPDPRPEVVEARVREDSERFLERQKRRSPRSEGGRNTFSDLVRVFVDLHHNLEIPARAATRENAGSMPEAYRDRLSFGYSWRDLAEFLGWQDARANRSMRLSLMLDALIDLGIAVPILCSRDGVIFRAYRHGEDAPFGEQEYALVYETADGFLEANGRPDIPRLTMEKLIVALLRIGVAKQFLAPFYGLSGSERIARVAYHRHGAVVALQDEPTVFADSQDAWLSRHLVNVGVLLRTPNRHYGLGERPIAAFFAQDAMSEARKIGRLLGMLTRHPGSGKSPVLDENDLTLLTTCAQPRDAAGAVLAELRIFNQWFENHRRRLEGLRIASERQCERTLEDLVRGGGYAAFNSARLKMTGYWQGKPAAIAETCALAFEAEGMSGRFIADEWRAMWGPVLKGGIEDQSELFGRMIGKIGDELVTIALGVFTMELSLASRLMTAGKLNATRYSAICEKVLSWMNVVEPNVLGRHGNQQGLARLREICLNRSAMPDPQASYDYGFRRIDRAQLSGRALVAQAADELRNYGRLQRRTDLTYALWYDVIDSVGQKSGLTGEELHRYRARVAAFKTAANGVIAGIVRDAARRGTDTAVTPASLRSTDDEKSILFGKSGGRECLRETARLLLTLAEDRGVRIRLMVINADFAGEAAYRLQGDPVIMGSDFWEYSSRLKKKLSELEDDLNRSAPPRHPAPSLTWLCGEMAASVKEFDFLSWGADPIETSRSVPGGGLPIQVRIFGGRSWPGKPRFAST
ncbi:MAG TPA: hypothetical protein VEA44_10190 [Caulobacter sp.]|nr:hypothetical protein [Caulobacter sp.]